MILHSFRHGYNPYKHRHWNTTYAWNESVLLEMFLLSRHSNGVILRHSASSSLHSCISVNGNANIQQEVLVCTCSNFCIALYLISAGCIMKSSWWVQPLFWKRILYTHHYIIQKNTISKHQSLVFLKAICSEIWLQFSHLETTTHLFSSVCRTL